AVLGGGNAPYSYQWSNGLGTSTTVSNLSAGVYSVIITSSPPYNGCSHTVVKSFTVSQPAIGITANLVTTDLTCANTLGTVQVQAVYGNSGSSSAYLWSNSATTSQISVTSAGVYTVTITDGAGCAGIASATVAQINTAQIGSTNVYTSSNVCAGNSETVYLTALGFTSVYCDVFYSLYSSTSASGPWVFNSNGNANNIYFDANGNSNFPIANLTAGYYKIEITSIQLHGNPTCSTNAPNSM